LALLTQLLLDAFCRQLQWFRTVSALTKSPTGNTSFSKSAALANGIKGAHFVSRYNISGLVCPLSQVLIGRNV
jgi:hypothetical protein